jgi:hypothetical protein
MANKIPLHPDSAIIDQLGGSTKLSDALKYGRNGGPQRVNNWRTRGIPAAVKLDRQDLFRPRKRRKASSAES